MLYRNDNMLLRIAQGDAYGHGCEYIKFPRDQEIYDAALQFQHYIAHPTHNMDAGTYTDDTQMSIANARLLIDKAAGVYAENLTMSARDFAVMFWDTFVRDRRDGYSRAFQAILDVSTDVDDLISRLIPNSEKNGAAMRAVPFGVLQSEREIIELAETQAKVTHNTWAGSITSKGIALMSHYALYENRPLSKIQDIVVGHLGFQVAPWVAPWPDGQQVRQPDVGLKTLQCVIHLVSTGTSLMDILEKALVIGGDTDSTAAIAWGIASCRYQDEVLPPFFEGGLENGAYGCDYLKDLGRQLMDAYNV